MTRQKESDEVFCRSCGEPIKKQAEVCPACGVKNRQKQKSSEPGQQSTTSSSPPTTRSTQHDPSQYQTTVSEDWYYIVAASVIGWVIFFMLPSAVVGPTLVGLIGLASWVGVPLATFFDSQYVRANSKWNPSGLWILGGAIPVINIFSGGAYLYRRHETLDEP